MPEHVKPSYFTQVEYEEYLSLCKKMNVPQHGWTEFETYLDRYNRLKTLTPIKK